MLDTTANPALDRTTPPSGSRPTGPRWHVVATHSQAERRATYNLAQQGYETYLPLVTVRRRDAAIRSLMHRVEVPLFAGYAFVRFDATRDPWRPITNTPGVYALLRSSSTGLPHPCPDAAVEALRAGDALRRTPTPTGASWSPGAACKAQHGPFKGHEAVVVSVTGPKATIALPLFGGLRELTVPVEWLMARAD